MTNATLLLLLVEYYNASCNIISALRLLGKTNNTLDLSYKYLNAEFTLFITLDLATTKLRVYTSTYMLYKFTIPLIENRSHKMF